MSHPWQLRFSLELLQHHLSLYSLKQYLHLCRDAYILFFKNLICSLLRKQFPLSVNKYIFSVFGGLITVVNSMQMSNNNIYTPGAAHFIAKLMDIIVLSADAVTAEAPLWERLDSANSSSSRWPTKQYSWASQPRWCCLWELLQ